MTTADTWTVIRAETPLTYEVDEESDLVHLDLGPRHSPGLTSTRLQIHRPTEMLDVLLDLFTRARTDYQRVTRGDEAFIAWPYR
ncbi:hypothetical protein [Actinophytocola gossypii]|uniref:Uncharacterized protein n=1 Tax=Actinophytocola gossypii TaxID=2812003 RepID=A0ABT2J6E1_9PSEU|nr:hypothetical protein [Actinophytocola gossypii]MCT2583060.1 hypothetical protein [Actinophytocola gossypii]